MTVDNYKFVPKAFRSIFESVQAEVSGPVWAPFEKPLSSATIAVLSSAGIFVRDEQEPFDVEREKREPTWGDPTWRVIGRDIPQEKVDAVHLHINTDPVKKDIGVAMGLRALMALETEGVIGQLAKDNYSVMGYQEENCEVWKNKTGPEIVADLRKNKVDALLLAPA